MVGQRKLLPETFVTCCKYQCDNIPFTKIWKTDLRVTSCVCERKDNMLKQKIIETKKDLNNSEPCSL